MYNETFSLLDLIKKSTSPWHTVQTAADILGAVGFQELSWNGVWDIAIGGSYFVRVYGSSLLAFSIGAGDVINRNGLRIAAAHTDFPGFRIKPAASIIKDGYGLLNIEGYGGAILQSWQDRPLSIAGKVALKGTNVFSPAVKLVDFSRSLMTIPSLAIHLNKKINDGVALNKQTQMLPLTAVLGDKGSKNFFDEYLAAEIGCNKEDILSYELNVYAYEGGCQLGMASEMISAGRLDNLTSVHACLQGLINSKKNSSDAKTGGINLIALFDNEEIGSRTKQGADSAVLLQVLERIYALLGYDRQELWQAINGGFMISADVAHGVHPNYIDKYDPTNRPTLNNGVVLKQAASQSYAGDAEAVAIVIQLCKKHNIPYQNFVNRADSPGGATLGSIASSLVPIRAVDIGVPILAMHSARETMGVADQVAINKLIEAFFSE